MSDVTLNYEDRLDRDPKWAMSEGDRYFDEKSETHATLQRIGRRLNELKISYCIVGGMALFKHGFRRFTEDVDILVAPDDLKTIHQNLTGLGYTPLFEGSKNLRDTQSGVRIEFLLAGSYPGDGKEKPVAFPNPEDVSEVADDLSYVNLPTLIELKLASGMSGADCMKDLGDVQELIKTLPLPHEELWRNVNGTRRRYLKLVTLDEDVKSWDELIARSGDSDGELSRMRDAGVTLERHPTRDDAVWLMTTDPEVAKQFDMHDESEFLE